MQRMKWKVLFNDSRFLPALYVITMMFAFTTRYGDLELSYHLQIIIGLFWILIGGQKLIEKRIKLKTYGLEYIEFIKLYITPHLVIHVYTIFLMLIGKVSWSYFTTNLTVYVPTLLAIIAVYLFKGKAIKYTFAALIMSWFLSVGVSLICKGPIIFYHAILQAYVNPLDNAGGLTVNYLELHDLVLAIGYMIVLYMYEATYSSLNNQDFKNILMIAVIMILGMKRVSILALLIVFVFCLYLKFRQGCQKYKLCIISGTILIGICYLFIYLVSNGDVFFDFIKKFGINVMGRNYYYKAIMEYASFKLTYMGIGRNVITKILNTKLSYLNVGGVHSDIIKMYVENGFIMFGAWLWYNLIFITKFYKKRYGTKSSVFYFCIMIYTFTLYFTDNIEIYYICQILSILLPVSYALKGKKGELCVYKKNTE